MTKTFKALLINLSGPGQTTVASNLSSDSLPEGDVTVRVRYSTLNYKDALAIAGTSPVVRQFPMVPGIDFAGVVEESASDAYQPGDWVVLNGWGVGERHWGGLSQLARVRSEWLVPLPAGLTPRHAMALGTAGYTAMLCVMSLQRLGVTPTAGEIAVSGAAGGVGSVAIMLLSQLGFNVVAITGRTEESDYLKTLGATSVVDRREMANLGKPLQKERWAGVVDTTGSNVLANLCASTRYGGVVTACGLAAGMDFPSTVAPFILRGVTLAGIDSVSCPIELRRTAWMRLDKEANRDKLDFMSSDISLAKAVEIAPELLKGNVRGRLVVSVDE